jgi:adenosylcobinamide kinase/adenosylcobinamide-phosphate guanylyltransferase
MSVVLIGGGARSGKSRFALDYGNQRWPRRAFIATARPPDPVPEDPAPEDQQPPDHEMARRIRQHQRARGPHWTTIEEPLDILGAIQTRASDFDGFVVDCLTLWLSNLMAADGLDPGQELSRLEDGLRDWTGPGILLVTNEVGCGIVPDNPLARQFRDLAGEANQRLAKISSEVYWMVFGVPLKLSSLAAGKIPTE